MRSEQEMFALLLNIAESDERIRVVLLSGSRADVKAKKDRFQDFDIVFLVRKIESFLSDHSWIDILGERLIVQMPKGMGLGEENNNAEQTLSFSYLMLFTDGNRIDLTLFPVDESENNFIIDSLTISLLDKDNLFSNLPKPGNKDYLIRRPTEKEFLDCCNEFWWVSTYVAKGLFREEITYAKEMLEVHVRKMFFKMIEWYIGIEKGFTVSFGKGGKFMKENVSPLLYQRVLSTYPDAKAENVWKSLFIMSDIFSELAAKVALTLNFEHKSREDQNVTKYLKAVHSMTKQAIPTNDPRP